VLAVQWSLSRGLSINSLKLLLVVVLIYKALYNYTAHNLMCVYMYPFIKQLTTRPLIETSVTWTIGTNRKPCATADMDHRSSHETMSWWWHGL